MSTTRTVCNWCGKTQLFDTYFPPSDPDQSVRLLKYSSKNILDLMFCNYDCLFNWLSKQPEVKTTKQLPQPMIDV